MFNSAKWRANLPEWYCCGSHEKICKFSLYLYINKIVAAFRGMHLSPTKQSYVWLPKKCDYRTDTRTDRHQTKWSLCAAMLRRWHNKNMSVSTCIKTNVGQDPHFSYSLNSIYSLSQTTSTGSKCIVLITGMWSKFENKCIYLYETCPLTWCNEYFKLGN